LSGIFLGPRLIEQNASRCAKAEPAGAFYRELGLHNKAAERASGMHRI